MKTSAELRNLAKNVEDYVRGEQVVFTNGGITAGGLRVAADEIDRLTARVAELEADAKRYRWLRENSQSWGSRARIVVDVETKYRSSPESVDAAIDAAIATETLP